MSKPLFTLVTEENQARLAQERSAEDHAELSQLPEFQYVDERGQPASSENLSKPEMEATSKPMDQQLVDTKIALSEARNDAKFAELSGKVDRLAEKLDHISSTFSDNVGKMREDNRETRSTVRTWGLSVAALVVAVPGVIATIVGVSIDWADKHPAIVATPAPIVIQSQAPAQLPPGKGVSKRP